MPPMFGVAELGGTKALVGFGDPTGALSDVVRVPTTSPTETMSRVIAHLGSRDDLTSIGIASFGPLELREHHDRFGHITNTTKPGWSQISVLKPVQEAFDLPIGLDTDVNGAALGEGRWGAARGLEDFVYLTVGTGIGGGAVSGGRLVRGLAHPEMGHVVVERRAGDRFEGVCDYHGDCLEGMASGPALEARFGKSVRNDAEEAVELAAFYLAQGIRDFVYTLSPQRVVVGGGVANLAGLVPAIERHLAQRLGSYPGLAEHDAGFVVRAGLGDRSGLAGALILAENAQF